MSKISCLIENENVLNKWEERHGYRIIGDNEKRY